MFKNLTIRSRLIFILSFLSLLLVIIGGLGSLWGTLVGGIVLGVAQVLGDHAQQGWGMLAGHLRPLAAQYAQPGDDRRGRRAGGRRGGGGGVRVFD